MDNSEAKLSSKKLEKTDNLIKTLLKINPRIPSKKPKHWSNKKAFMNQCDDSMNVVDSKHNNK